MLRDYTTNERIEDVQGRPGLGQRKPSKYQLKDITVNNTNATASISITRKEVRKDLQALENQKRQLYLMNTGDNDPKKTAPRGSIFVNTDLRETAENTAKFIIEKQEFRSGEQSVLATFFNHQLEEGDFLTFTFNNVTRKRRILGVSHVIEFKGTTVDGVSVVTGATQLNLGVVSELGDNVKITIFDEGGTIVDDDNNNSSIDDSGLIDIFLPPYYQDKELGSRLKFTSKRGDVAVLIP